MKTLLRMPLLLLMLAGCDHLGTSTPTLPVTGATSVAPLVAITSPDYGQLCRLTPVQLSHADTQGTKDQVVRLNAYTDALCVRRP